MTPHNNLDLIFDKFINGSATAEEKALLWKWIYLLDARQQQVMYSQQEKEMIREKIRGQVIQQMQPAAGRQFKMLRYAVAAAVLIMIAAGAFWFIAGQQQNNKQSLASIVDAGHKIRKFYLPDSTQVTLNMASSLQWSRDYNSTERKVILTGEGYFEVHKDSKRPFLVESQGIITKALGTAFNIEAYQQESEIRVALLEGAVQVNSIEQIFPATILQPGQLLRFSPARSTAQVQTSATGNAIAWTTGGMSFHEIPLSEALDRLALRYHITIQFDRQKLQSKIVSGSFKAAPWQQILPNILFIHNLHYEIKDNLIRIN